MQALFEMDEGLRRLKEILTSFPIESPHWSEAQNRFQFIDRLLIECLGWEKPLIQVEVTDELGGRCDYELGSPVKAVLEAKREATQFRLLPSSKSNSVRRLKPLITNCKALKAAVEQVIPYCAMRGVQIAIVCNGPQLIVFQTYIPGRSPLEGECYVFDGLNAYLSEFPLLWTLLSPEGIAENRANRNLELHRNPRIPQKGSAAIPEPTKYRYRSTFQENLRELSSLLLEEIEDNPNLRAEFYRDCYVKIEANNRHLLLSKNIIASRYRRVGHDSIEPAPISRVVKASGGSLNLANPGDTTVGSRPIVVIGDVGVGKTSFFENLYLNLDTADKEQTYFIPIDLGTKANLSSDLKTYILTEIPKVLREKYDVDIEEAAFVTGIYHEEIERFDRGIFGKSKQSDQALYQTERVRFLSSKLESRDSHLHASLGHLARGRGKKILLVLDNADQRSFETQQDAFLIAQELAATRNLTVFVALRPSTFYQSKSAGALSAYQNRLLTISPPPADEVIEKRLGFAARVASGSVRPDVLSGIQLRAKGVVAFLMATLRSIRTNDSIRQFLSNITGGNTRAVIELITGFCGSPNVDSEKIVQIELEKGNYKVPLHEFTKHALLGEYAYFNAQSSFVACNIFDVNSADEREHFLASLIVAFLSSNTGARNNDGFVSGAAIISEMRRNGFVDDQTRNSLRRLAEKRLIETPHAHFRELEVGESDMAENFYYRATSVGIYHVRHWTGSFAFMDATATDTPIFDANTRELIHKRGASFDIKDRYEKAAAFQSYLEKKWDLANIGATFYDFRGISAANSSSFSDVLSFINKPKEKKGVGGARDGRRRGR